MSQYNKAFLKVSLFVFIISNLSFGQIVRANASDNGISKSVRCESLLSFVEQINKNSKLKINHTCHKSKDETDLGIISFGAEYKHQATMDVNLEDGIETTFKDRSGNIHDVIFYKFSSEVKSGSRAEDLLLSNLLNHNVEGGFIYLLPDNATLAYGITFQGVMISKSLFN